MGILSWRQVAQDGDGQRRGAMEALAFFDSGATGEEEEGGGGGE